MSRDLTDMDRQAALRALDESLARPSVTSCTWRKDRDVYIAEQIQEFRKRIIEPLAVQAISNEWAQKHVEGVDGLVRNYLALAHADGQWLLFDPEAGTFSLAFGKQDAMPLGLLGFSSDDALAEWLG